jgi:hypothetical protein
MDETKNVKLPLALPGKIRRAVGVRALISICSENVQVMAQNLRPP